MKKETTKFLLGLAVSLVLLFILYKFVFSKDDTNPEILNQMEKDKEENKQRSKERSEKIRSGERVDRTALKKAADKEANKGGGKSRVAAKKGLSTSGSRGIRNNNVGNIRINRANNWLGKIPVELNNDGAFEQFEEKKFGDRALLKILLNYKKKHGLDTIEDIIARFAPASENHTNAYIDFVEKYTGIPADKELSLNKTELRKLAKAIARFENGKEALTDKEFDVAYNLL